MLGKDLPWQCRTCIWLKCFSPNMAGWEKSVYACHKKPFALTKSKSGTCLYRLADSETLLGAVYGGKD